MNADQDWMADAIDYQRQRSDADAFERADDPCDCDYEADDEPFEAGGMDWRFLWPVWAVIAILAIGIAVIRAIW